MEAQHVVSTLRLTDNDPEQTGASGATSWKQSKPPLPPEAAGICTIFLATPFRYPPSRSMGRVSAPGPIPAFCMQRRSGARPVPRWVTGDGGFVMESDGLREIPASPQTVFSRLGSTRIGHRSSANRHSTEQFVPLDQIQSQLHRDPGSSGARRAQPDVALVLY